MVPSLLWHFCYSSPSGLRHRVFLVIRRVQWVGITFCMKQLVGWAASPFLRRQEVLWAQHELVGSALLPLITSCPTGAVRVFPEQGYWRHFYHFLRHFDSILTEGQQEDAPCYKRSWGIFECAMKLKLKMDNQQGPTVQHRELCSLLCSSLDARGVWGRMNTCVCMAECPAVHLTLSQHC